MGLVALPAAEVAVFVALDVEGVFEVTGFLAAGAFGVELVVELAALDAVAGAFFTAEVGFFFAAPVPVFFVELATLCTFAA